MKIQLWFRFSNPAYSEATDNPVRNFESRTCGKLACTAHAGNLELACPAHAVNRKHCKLTIVLNDEVCDATGDEQRGEAG